MKMIFHFLLSSSSTRSISRGGKEASTPAASWHLKSLAEFSIKLWRDEAADGAGRENTLKAKFLSWTTMENVFLSPFTEGAAIRAEASAEDEDADGKRNLWFLIINCAYIKRKEEVGKTATLPLLDGRERQKCFLISIFFHQPTYLIDFWFDIFWMVLFPLFD